MATLKNNIKNISDDAEHLVKDYIKLYSIKLSEKLALLLGIFLTVFILALLLLLIIVLCSIALASYLNEILASGYLGYLIISAIYILLFFLLLIKMLRSKTPLFSNLMARFIVSILDIDLDQTNNIKGLRKETEFIKQKIETDKIKLKADIQMIRYSMMESLFKGFFGLFKSKKKYTEPKETEASKPTKQKRRKAKNK